MKFSNAERAEILTEMRRVAAEKHRYHVIPYRSRWIVMESGSDRRAALTVRTKDKAVQQARELAMESQGELIVHGRDGHIQEHLSFRELSS
jgi:biotin-(acetyl-CoA carboxylase) ligase